MDVSPEFHLQQLRYVLSSEGFVVHKEKVDIADVVDEESLVAGGHHVAGLSV
jgi:hypothetical protein